MTYTIIPDKSTDDGYEPSPMEQTAIDALAHAQRFALWVGGIHYVKVETGADTFDAWISINDDICKVDGNGDLKHPSGAWEVLHSIYLNYGHVIPRNRTDAPTA